MWLKLQDSYDLATLRKERAGELDDMEALEVA